MSHQPVRLPSVEQVEAAARALWKMGNARIGARVWESVAAHYITEAAVALEAARGVAGDVDIENLGELVKTAVEHANSRSSIASSDPWWRLAAVHLASNGVRL